MSTNSATAIMAARVLVPRDCNDKSFENENMLAVGWTPVGLVRKYDTTHKLTAPRFQQLWRSHVDDSYAWADVPLTWDRPS